MTLSAHRETRRALHAVAELLLAGPQHRTSGTIRLRIAPHGFATVAAPDIAVDGDTLVAAGTRTAITGSTPRLLGAATGAGAGAPDGVYPAGDGPGLDDVLSIDESARTRIIDAFTRGAAALRRLANIDPILWPEHFDLAVRLAEVNYGISAGDAFLDEPYAYVGIEPVPVDTRSDLEFWNAPFGAARAMRDLPDVNAVHAFFLDARTRWATIAS